MLRTSVCDRYGQPKRPQDQDSERALRSQIHSNVSASPELRIEPDREVVEYN